ncbi:von Willebrand factor A domain containing 8 [Nesidiocoris tenuis]|uniref:von Willebrand factor A domain containing 8 n=1 Tax=Nesidiocoris tenuis TaxID=355587 RepID=A0ABN7A6B2_9HEMI|nr:von Willebrand factor A domain containing 8 [Nesidiocoris tenuis]
MSPQNVIILRRATVLRRILSNNRPQDALRLCYCTSTPPGESSVEITGVKKVVVPPKIKEYVPIDFLPIEYDQDTLHHLRWMLQKDLLAQDIFLIGPPGPSKRRLAFRYLELTQREMEFVSLSRDTTEADLKQRREIVSSTAKYVDQVRACVSLQEKIFTKMMMKMDISKISSALIVQ